MCKEYIQCHRDERRIREKTFQNRISPIFKLITLRKMYFLRKKKELFLSDIIIYENWIETVL